MSRDLSPPFARPLRAMTVALLLCPLGSCLVEFPPGDSLTRERELRSNLSVAEAALAAGQPAVARRLYLSLSRRFGDAAEPRLGLGHIAFRSNEHAAAEDYFLEAAELGRERPTARAEAMLGAARAALAQGKMDSARQRLHGARALEPDPPLAAWIANAIAVLDTLEMDFRSAEASYGEALRLSSGDPRIAANLVRMLLAGGRIRDAAENHAQHDPSYWLDGDGAALSRLIEESRRMRRALVLRLSSSSERTTPAERFEPGQSSAVLLRLSDRRDAGISPTGGRPAVRSAATPERAGRRPAARQAKTVVPTPKRPPPRAMSLAIGQSRRFVLEGDATSVLVAAPEVADVQLLAPDLVYVIGKGVGRTSVTVLGENGWVGDRIVSVGLDIQPLQAILADEPELEGVRVRRVARGISLSGEVGSAALVERALSLAAGTLPKDTPVDNRLQIPGTQQVNLEVQIAEVQRSATEDLGINWEAFRAPGSDLFGFRIGRLAIGGPLGAGAVGEFAPAMVDGQVSAGLFFGRQTANTRIAGMIDALARAGLANVLARPNVTAVSGEAASFFSGGEYPLPTGFEDGVIVFEYKKYGILLDFVPTVVDTGRIVLKVRPEVSEPSLSQSVQVVGVDIPVINVRRAETTVEVGNGESIVIAGLFRNSSDTRELGVPVAKDVPVLGALFGHRSIRSEELELIVIVTARLVRPGVDPADGQPPPSRRVRGYHY